jgi:hypothetical protein
MLVWTKSAKAPTSHFHVTSTDGQSFSLGQNVHSRPAACAAARMVPGSDRPCKIAFGMSLADSIVESPIGTIRSASPWRIGMGTSIPLGSSVKSVFREGSSGSPPLTERPVWSYRSSPGRPGIWLPLLGVQHRTIILYGGPSDEHDQTSYRDRRRRSAYRGRRLSIAAAANDTGSGASICLDVEPRCWIAVRYGSCLRRSRISTGS